MHTPNASAPHTSTFAESLSADGNFTIHVLPCLFELRSEIPTFMSPTMITGDFLGYRLQIHLNGRRQLPVSDVFLARATRSGNGDAHDIANQALEEERTVERVREHFKGSLLPIVIHEQAIRIQIETIG
jgi:hypothetical protein